MKVKKHSAQLH